MRHAKPLVHECKTVISLTNSFSLLQTETKNASIDAAEDAIGHDLIAAEDTASGVSFWDE